MISRPSLSSILDQLCEVLCGCTHRPRIVFHLSRPTKQPGTVVPTHQFVNPYLVPEEDMAAVDFDMADDDRIVLTIDPTQLKDRKGQVVTVKDPAWVTDNGDVVSLTPDPAGFSCQVDAVGPMGPDVAALIQWSATNPDGTKVLAQATAHVKIPGDVTDVTINVGAPTKQP